MPVRVLVSERPQQYVFERLFFKKAHSIDLRWSSISRALIGDKACWPCWLVWAPRLLEPSLHRLSWVSARANKKRTPTSRRRWEPVLWLSAEGAYSLRGHLFRRT